MRYVYQTPVLTQTDVSFVVCSVPSHRYDCVIRKSTAHSYCSHTKARASSRCMRWRAMRCIGGLRVTSRTYSSRHWCTRIPRMCLLCRSTTHTCDHRWHLLHAWNSRQTGGDLAPAIHGKGGMVCVCVCACCVYEFVWAAAAAFAGAVVHVVRAGWRVDERPLLSYQPLEAEVALRRTPKRHSM
jgi:hypothetical protein